ncbi:cellulose synthase operon C domain-containing protein [Enterobacter hormaechei]|mgnify:FL=1|jgi:tetratricopeptide (TPR) repeat protein|uniref:cellulose synthase complex outer membrane protein BcsC n=1 Tax=Enterobacter TaxID=547 RepID=UPI00044B5950|nr:MULTISPECIES: cellulose synthase complex outer membrane protein BcsC [Enterobacter]CAE7350482.1 Cellulose synthase operon protein C [Enterobacter cloacae]VAL58295.1 cellulose synthase operon C domain-containing protein [Enterobacter kobei]AWV74176.1 cellulose biosynthesis protein BcsC [Enterobacter hormaechei subsp. xiangfangensis]EHF5037951.1 cellulose biosynthesis protein BcsC [Enterobacter hormaechei]EHF5062352.1 cellulose biosynthesis protein BcsC [Enterobacter hormaechei]
MRTFTLNLLTLSLGLALMPLAQAANSPQQRQLLEQVRLGESTQREDLVRQSLYRLELIDPNNPDVIAARFRYLLRQGDMAGAQKELDRLKGMAPDSSAYQSSRTTMLLSTPDGRQSLQQARLLATTGHTQEAIAAYDKLFDGKPPSGDIATEYWNVVAKEPARRNLAINQLKKINASSPGNVPLQSSLAQLLFQSGRRDEGFAVLQEMAKSNNGRSQASDMWYQQIKDQPASSASVTALQQYLSVFSDGDNVTAARAQLEAQQKQLADPAFRAKAEGLAAVDAGQGSKAVTELQKAVSANHADSEAVGALGQAYSQKGDRARAVAQFEKAIALDPQSDNRGKWESLLKVNRYWLLIQQGDNALKANNTAQAERYYQQARNIDNTDSYAVLGLGDAAAARKDNDAAERYYRQALRMDSGNSNAVRGLANIYRAQSPEKATQFIQSLSASQRRSIDDIERSLTNEQLSAQAEQLESEGKYAQAAEIQRRRLALSPGDVWITYRLSRDLYSAGQRSQADNLMRQLASQKPGDPDQVYASGLYLSGNDQDRAALAHLNTLPRDKWNGNIQALADRLQSNQVLETANRLRDSGKEQEAETLLRQQPPSTRIDLTLADWAEQRGDHKAAKTAYNTVLQREPQNEDAILGLTEVYLAQDNKDAARTALAKLPAAQNGEPLSINMQRRLAMAQAGLGDHAAAEKTFNAILPQAKSQPPSLESALVMRDAARFQAQNGQPQQALDTWKDAMVSSGITTTRPTDNDSFTRLTRNDEKDDWLKRGVRSDAGDLYRQQDLNVTLQHDYWGSSGTGGYSDLKAHTTMLQVDAPLSDGRMFFRSDLVNMNAGSFATDNGTYDPTWGTCAETPCRGSTNQSANGASVAVGWQNKTWAWDIGTTPMGFDVVDVVGSLSYSNDLGPIGYTLNAHRRPISSSVLAFAGQKDPNTDTTWGGVRATGGGVSMSYDKGEANGIWSSLSADSLTGKNVEDNWRVRWMTGYYYKLINQNNERLTVGVSNMLWHYDKDLSGYSLGQGGYYSPQEYVSFALPVNWRKRTENWSWELGGSVSWSHSKTKDVMRYPLQGLIPDNEPGRYTDKGVMETGSSSSGTGYTARAIVERRVTSNWFVGLGVDIQEAKDYTPSHALLYVRYSAAGWQGDMDLPPEPLVPYADW